MPPGVECAQTPAMPDELASSLLHILHVLRDGDDPAAGLSDDELPALRYDLAQLVQLGFVEVSGTSVALTLAGLDELSKPGQSQPMSLDEMERYARKRKP